MRAGRHHGVEWIPTDRSAAAAADHSPVFWIRAGAVTGLLAVFVQSVRDTGLRMPANGLLLPPSRALALHQPAGSTRVGDDDRRQPTAAPAIEA